MRGWGGEVWSAHFKAAQPYKLGGFYMWTFLCVFLSLIISEPVMVRLFEKLHYDWL